MLSVCITNISSPSRLRTPSKWIKITKATHFCLWLLCLNRSLWTSSSLTESLQTHPPPMDTPPPRHRWPTLRCKRLGVNINPMTNKSEQTSWVIIHNNIRSDENYNWDDAERNNAESMKKKKRNVRRAFCVSLLQLSLKMLAAYE